MKVGYTDIYATITIGHVNNAFIPPRIRHPTYTHIAHNNYAQPYIHVSMEDNRNRITAWNTSLITGR